MRKASKDDAWIEDIKPSDFAVCKDVLAVVLSIIDIADRCKTGEETVTQISNAILSHYRSFFYSAYLTERKPGSDRVDCYRVLVCKGFPVTKQHLEDLINENMEWLLPLEATRTPYFSDDFSEAKDSLRGNLFNERSAAIVPLVSQGEIIGWFTLSSTDPSFKWTDVEKLMLVSIGRVAGAMLRQKLDSDQLRDRVDTQYRTELAAELKNAISSVLGDSLFAMPSTDSDDRIERERALAVERVQTLTSRERTILLELAQGKTNAQISDGLFISNSTTKKHVESILAKLHLSNRVQAAVYVEKYALRSFLEG